MRFQGVVILFVSPNPINRLQYYQNCKLRFIISSCQKYSKISISTWSIYSCLKLQYCNIWDTQELITRSKSTIETPEKVVKYVYKVSNRDTRTTSLTSFWCLFCELLTYFTPFSSVLIVSFEHEFVCWVRQ